MLSKKLTPETEKLLELLERKEKLVAMLAPSFVVEFSYPEIIGMLKRLGFNYVVEVARGAKETNRQLLALMKLHPEKRFITSPCPSIVRLIRNKYPELLPFLAKIDSPMSATARIVLKEYPDCKRVFIGPCFVKKIEAKEDWPELEILVLTYKEIKEVFEIKGISPLPEDKNEHFDIACQETRLYPISGGLAQSSGIIRSLTDPQYDVVSGPKLAEEFLKKFPYQTDLKVLDILYCEGGCINGAGIISEEPLDKRRQRVIKYWLSN